jgi:RNA polymerase-binding transcription factor DksA
MSLMTNQAPKEENLRYSEQELKEFEDIINKKLDNARNELSYIKSSLNGTAGEGIDGTVGNAKLMEDVADSSEKESLNQLAARLQKFIRQLELALIRIKNGTYGVCVDTGKLIPKERLRVVPHTQQSVEAKKARM